MNWETGDMVFAFVREDASEDDIYFSMFNSIGVQTKRPTGVALGSSAGDDEESPSVAMNTLGEFAITWQDDSRGDDHVYARTFDASGESIGFAVVASEDDEYDPQVAANITDNSWIFSWTSENSLGILSTEYAVYDQALDNIEYSTSPNMLDFQSSVAMNARGDFVVVATDDVQPNKRLRVISRLYDPAGRDANDSAAEAYYFGVIEESATQRIQSLNRGDVDMYQFYVPPEQFPAVFTVETTSRPGGDPVNTEVRLFDRYLNPVMDDFGRPISDVSSGEGLYSKLSFRVEGWHDSLGTYYIGVSHDQNDSYDPITGSNDSMVGEEGDYALTITRHQYVTWQNPENQLDISGDGFVTPLDALIAINRITKEAAVFFHFLLSPPSF